WGGCAVGVSWGVASWGGRGRATGEPLPGANDFAVFGLVAAVTMRGDPGIPARDPHEGRGVGYSNFLRTRDSSERKWRSGRFLKRRRQAAAAASGGAEPPHPPRRV